MCCEVERAESYMHFMDEETHREDGDFPKGLGKWDIKLGLPILEPESDLFKRQFTQRNLPSYLFYIKWCYFGLSFLGA